MNWININILTLDSPEFVGSDPVDRATWLCLLRYCCGRENGGVIEDCGDWSDRKWQQLVRVTKGEVERSCALWTYDGERVTVWAYPDAKEAEVKVRRDLAITNGRKGGRPKNPPITDVGNPAKTNNETQRKPTTVILAKAEREGEREREGEGNEKKRPKNIGTLSELEAFAVELGLPASDGTFLFSHFEETGWKRGRETVKDWRATMRKWKLGGWLPSQRNGHGRPTGQPTTPRFAGIQEQIPLIDIQ